MTQSIKGKRRARKLALQALYQWLMTKDELINIEAQFRAINNMENVDIEYFQRLLHGVPQQLTGLEAMLTPCLDRSLQTLTPIELSVLRLAAFELLYCPEIPYRVVLDEAITLSKMFGAQDGYRYVNGVLNKLARQVRIIETNQDHG